MQQISCRLSPSVAIRLVISEAMIIMWGQLTSPIIYARKSILMWSNCIPSYEKSKTVTLIMFGYVKLNVSTNGTQLSHIKIEQLEPIASSPG